MPSASAAFAAAAELLLNQADSAHPAQPKPLCPPLPPATDGHIQDVDLPCLQQSCVLHPGWRWPCAA